MSLEFRFWEDYPAWAGGVSSRGICGIVGISGLCMASRWRVHTACVECAGPRETARNSRLTVPFWKGGKIPTNQKWGC